jgi:phosphoglycolate phosphatase-like HAD superfamily hydrolase
VPILIEAIVKLLLFDVDGTLVLTAGSAVRAMDQAFFDVFGVRGAFEHVSMPGRTDGAILNDAFVRAAPQSHMLADAMSATGVRATDAHVAAFKSAYFACFASEITQPVVATPGGSTRPRFKGVLPGVSPLLEALSAREDVFLALLTGNYEQGARIKLEYFDLWRYFRCGAFGDDAHDRNDLVSVAMTRAWANGCRVVPPGDVIVIGDTPLDVACARHGGVSCVAVATGGYSVDQLRAAGADVVFETLADTGAVVAALAG